MIYLMLLNVLFVAPDGGELVHENLKLDRPKTEKLRVYHDTTTDRIQVFNRHEEQPILTHHVLPTKRPYIHPIVAPDRQGILTEYQPSHHLHQTGLFWGLKMVNGRDFFMNWQHEHWRRVSAKILKDKGTEVSWQTVYDLLDDNGEVVLTERQYWTMQEIDGKYILDLTWKGEARINITFGKFYVGGLFLRMPWRKGIPGEVINANGQRNQEAEQQRSIWTDIGLKVEGRKDLAHIAIFDHPDNQSFPTPWRVDGELGVGPSRQILGDWHLNKGDIEEVRHRLFIYTGTLDKSLLQEVWKKYACE